MLSLKNLTRCLRDSNFLSLTILKIFHKPKSLPLGILHNLNNNTMWIETILSSMGQSSWWMQISLMRKGRWRLEEGDGERMGQRMTTGIGNAAR